MTPLLRHKARANLDPIEQVKIAALLLGDWKVRTPWEVQQLRNLSAERGWDVRVAVGGR